MSQQCSACLKKFKTKRGLIQHQNSSKFCSANLEFCPRVTRSGRQSAHSDDPPNPAQNLQVAEDLLEDYWETIEEDDDHGQRDPISGTDNDDCMPFSIDSGEEVQSDTSNEEESDESDEEDNDESDEEYFVPSSYARDQFEEYCQYAQNSFDCFSIDEQNAIKLMNLLRIKGATLDTYDAVMEWHLRVIGKLLPTQSLGQSTRYISRKKIMKKLAKRYNWNASLYDSTRIILPSSRAAVDVVHHNARDMVVSLLTDPRITEQDYVFFDNNPFAAPPEDLDYVADFNTGSAYLETYKELITQPERQILVPIVLYIDGAVTGQYDKLEVTAMKLTLGIFNRTTRDKEYAWRTLGYVPNYQKETSRSKKMFYDSGHLGASRIGAMLGEEEGEVDDDDYVHNAQDFHRILEEIMASYKRMEQQGMIWDFRWHEKVYKDTELIFFIVCIKCDTKEADALCGKYQSRGQNVSQLCRFCTCPTAQSDDPKANYSAKTEPMICKLVRNNKLQELQTMSQHPINNAMHGLRFGLHNEMGIHRACPMEMLHAILLGVFTYIRQCFFEQIGPSSGTAEEINALAKCFGILYQRQSDRDLPKTNFSNGIQKGKIMAKEFSGLLLVMATIVISTKGREHLKAARSKNFAQDYLLTDWSLLIESLLQWEAFLKSEEMLLSDVKKLEKKNRFIMYLIRTIANRSSGMGLNVIKFHAIVHLYLEIIRFGVPMNIDTGSNESHHKKTKKCAKLTQRDMKLFEKQTGIRVVECFLLVGQAHANKQQLRQESRGTLSPKMPTKQQTIDAEKKKMRNLPTTTSSCWKISANCGTRTKK